MKFINLKLLLCPLILSGILAITSCSNTNNLPKFYPEQGDPIKISDTLTMKYFSDNVEQNFMAADLNKIISFGYTENSLYKDAFAEIFPEILLFRADGKSRYMFHLGQRTETVYPSITDEYGYYISAHDAAVLFGGEWVKGEEISVFTLCGSKIEYGSDEAVFFNKSGEVENITVKTIDQYSGEIFINANHIATMTGLVLYKTASGLLIYSAGNALDPLKGYYIAEEACKLFLETENEIATFSANMFVDIPKIMYTGETSVKVYSYPSLDLNAQVLAYASQGVKPSVTLGPAIVAGQGENEMNSTVIRIFDAYQTLHTQFRAYEENVKGGVQVACAANGDNYAILTAPYMSDDITSLKVFDANGTSLFSITPENNAPYVIAAGSFLGNEDCFAVMSMYGNNSINYYSAKDGSHIGKTELSKEIKGKVLLSTDHSTDGTDILIITVLEDTTKAFAIKGSEISEIDIRSSEYNGVFSSAFGGYIATQDATDEYMAFSTVSVFKDGVESQIDVGNKENSFYSTIATDIEDSFIKKGIFWHTRMEFSGSKAFNSVEDKNTASIRSSSFADFCVQIGDENTKYNTQYNMWGPCTTHRWNAIPQTLYLINYINPDTGEYEYAAHNREGVPVNYQELSSSFFNASYAPYVQAMDKLRSWTLRSYLGQLSVLYKNSPENTVALSPVHEHEINTGNASVGDYSSSMIKGFRDHMLYKYGSVETVNYEFDTDFITVDEIDPPRNLGRGKWDKYSTANFVNKYHTEWEIYNRTIVSQRIAEAYREALLAGFPPELIKAHQIPEGDAVSGFLGEANTRISPVDAVLNFGTSYGGTRYGVWYENEKSFYTYAYDSGHRNITLGEYSAMSTDPESSYNQLKYMVDKGLLFTHVMPWTDNAENGDIMDKNEKLAIDRLQSENVPRSTSSGGVDYAHEYIAPDGNSYNIVELGSKDESTGLLKSIKEDGTHEGSVYLQPFHAHVKTVDLAKSENLSDNGKIVLNITGRKGSDAASVVGINHGDSVDIRINAKKIGGEVTVKVLNGNYEIEDLTVSFKIEKECEYRYEFKNQLYFENCNIVIEYNDVEASLDAVFIYEMSARRYYGETSPQAHKGGISFDLITK